MDEPNKPKKKSTEDMIADAAEQGARKVLQMQRQAYRVNHYRAMEDLLRAYKNSRRWEKDPESYGFFPVEKSHDISVAPPPGLGLRDKVEINELYVQSRETSYIRSITRFAEVEAVVKLFEARPEFIVIRMYYFGEDVHGNERAPGAQPYSFEEIADELRSIGVDRNVKTIRTWRTKLVQDMTVMLFGVDGALSVEAREPKQGSKAGDANGERREDTAPTGA